MPARHEPMPPSKVSGGEASTGAGEGAPEAQTHDGGVPQASDTPRDHSAPTDGLGQGQFCGCHRCNSCGGSVVPHVFVGHWSTTFGPPSGATPRPPPRPSPPGRESAPPEAGADQAAAGAGFVPQGGSAWAVPGGVRMTQAELETFMDQLRGGGGSAQGQWRPDPKYSSWRSVSGVQDFVRAGRVG